MHPWVFKRHLLSLPASPFQSTVKGAYDMLFALKANLRDVVGEMEAWSKEPVLVRKSKPMTPDEFEAGYKVSRTSRYAQIQEGGKSVDRKLKESAVIMKVGKGNPLWSAYVDFVNGIVVQGLARLVVVSLRKLVDLLSPEKIRKNQDLPMLVIDCLLTGAPAKVRFQPDVGEDCESDQCFPSVVLLLPPIVAPFPL